MYRWYTLSNPALHLRNPLKPYPQPPLNSTPAGTIRGIESPFHKERARSGSTGNQWRYCRHPHKKADEVELSQPVPSFSRHPQEKCLQPRTGALLAVLELAIEVEEEEKEVVAQVEVVGREGGEGGGGASGGGRRRRWRQWWAWWTWSE